VAIVSRYVVIAGEPKERSRAVEFARLPDGRWSSDALFAVRYGSGETVYRRALVIDELSIGPIVATDASFPSFREASPELLGWALRIGSGLPGIATSSAPENNDRDAVRLARLLEAHAERPLDLPPPYDYDDGSPVRFVRVGDRCLFCGADTARTPETTARREKGEITSTLSHWYPPEERDRLTNLIGWTCAPCGLGDPCACPVCPDCELTVSEPGLARCSECLIACPPHFASAALGGLPAAYRPIEGIHAHGLLERRLGDDRLLAIDAPHLADRLLGAEMRIESEAYLRETGGTSEALLVLWRRGPGAHGVRGLLVDSADKEAIAYAEARAVERSDVL
jgi:hypothetical protein